MVDIESRNGQSWILVVDDHHLSRRYTVQALRQITRNVKEAGDGREAVELALRFRPRLIFLDLHLPDAQGIEVLHCIRSSLKDHEPQPEFVILSGESVAGESRHEDAGALRFVKKPASFQEIQELARHVLPPTQTVQEERIQSAPTASLHDLFQSDLEIRFSRLDESLARQDWPTAQNVLHQMIAGCAICGVAEIERYCRLVSAAISDPDRTDRISQAYFGLLRAIERSRLNCQA